jgi:hypothetical protein
MARKKKVDRRPSRPSDNTEKTPPRVGYGFEIDPLHVDAAISRWQSFTMKARTGKTFDDVENGRAAEQRKIR